MITLQEEIDKAVQKYERTTAYQFEKAGKNPFTVKEMLYLLRVFAGTRSGNGYTGNDDMDKTIYRKLKGRFGKGER